MDEHSRLAERFGEQRGHLQAVAYRMLGSLSEAEDAVQEAWLRVSRADSSAVQNLGGWMATIVGRICLDHLRARASRREEMVGTDVPESATEGGQIVILKAKPSWPTRLAPPCSSC